MYLKHERSTSQQTRCKGTKKNFPVKPHFNIPRKDIDRKRKITPFLLGSLNQKKKIHINKVSKRVNKNKNNFPFLSIFFLPHNNKKKLFSFLKKIIFFFPEAYEVVKK